MPEPKQGFCTLGGYLGGLERKDKKLVGELAMPGNARNRISSPDPLWANEQVGNSRLRDTYAVTCTMAPTSA